jgi:hypothetical protein
MKIQVIFPMAGDGTRFGGQQFKPFLDATEKLFIELAKEPFEKYDVEMEYIYVYREDQDSSFNVTARLNQLFPNESKKICLLKEKTTGPAHTLALAAQQYNITGPAFVCDCDHAINIQPMIKVIQSGSIPDVIVPLLEIKESEQHNFGKVKLDKENNVLGFYEKEIVPFSSEYSVKGLVGCYFFKNVEDILLYPPMTNISDFLPLYLKNHSAKFVDILEAGLFGTPESLIQFRFQLARKMTFFVDIDGTLVYLPKHVTYDANDAKLLPGAIEKLTEWKRQGHTIVLTTGRESARREKLIKMLSDLNVPYDQLVTNLRPGPRILINDKKPYSEIHQMARAVQVRRNQGIAHIHIQETPDILEKLKGGSFANVYLLNKDGKKIVRKYIEKSTDNHLHVDTLRRQCDDLQRFDYYSPGLVPKILSRGENESELYYDMEYLTDHKELSTYPLDIQIPIVKRVLEILNRDIYCYSKRIDGKQWMKQFLNEKIFAKYAYLESLGPAFASLLSSPTVTIHGKECRGIRSFFGTGDDLPSYLFPEYVSPIHGDLTLENILYDKLTDTFYLIDTSGSRYVDSKDMDSAKLLQSFLAKYETWHSNTQLSEFDKVESYNLPEEMIQMAKENFTFLFPDHSDPHAFQRAVFMLACYFLRMTPFLLKMSKGHALFGCALATYYLSFVSA